MSQVTLNNADFARLFSLLGVDDLDELKSLQGLGNIPDADNILSAVGSTSALPELAPPTCALSLDTLLKSIGEEVRRQACKDGVESLEIKGEQQKEINNKELEEIQKRLEQMRSKAVASGFKKAFAIIGAIVGAIASVATVTAGVLSANPLLVAGGIIGAITTIDSIVSLASDGKYSIAAGFTELGKKCGMSDNAAMWFGFGMNMVVIAVSVGVSIGAGVQAIKAVDAVAEASTALRISSGVSTATNFAGGAVSVGTGGTTIATTVYDYRATSSMARSKELEAILERIRQSIEMEKDLVESEMERAETLVADVKEIVEGCVEAQTSILTAAPSMA